jgi:pimeloyl-ACP methyl ester carboxylesterase
MSAPTSITINDRRIRVRVDGSPEQPAILLLHGVGRSLEDWAPQHQRLAGYRTIALDIPGSGFSVRPPEPMSVPALARGVAATLDALGEQRPLHVIGNSLGAAVGLQLLCVHPERVTSLVLVNPAGFGSEVYAMVRLVSVPGIGSFAARHPTRVSARMIERAVYADRSLATRQRIDHALAIARQPENGPVLHELVREIATARGFRRRWRAELLAEAAKHRRPTLIMWGDRDRILPVRHLNTARRLLPHAKTHLFTDIGHMPQIECPDEFAELVRAFIVSTSATGG